MAEHSYASSPHSKSCSLSSFTLFKLPDPGATIYVQSLLKFPTWGAQGRSKSPPHPVVPPPPSGITLIAALGKWLVSEMTGYPPVHGLAQWTTLKWTTPKYNFPNEYSLMFLAASIIKLHITSAYVHPVQPLATILNNCTWNKQLSNTN